MTPEERSLLERTYKLAEENNTILIGIRRMSRISGIMRIIYWVIILIISFGAYYFIQPYVQTMIELYSGIQGGNLNANPSTTSLFLDLLK